MKVLSKSLTVILALCLLAAPLSANAADSYVILNGFAFDIDGGGNAVIHSYDDRSADVVIPEKLMGADVVKIDDYAFFNDIAIDSVSFDSAASLSSIGSAAFYGCTGITSLNIPAYVSELNFAAFQNCTSLEDLSIEEGITVIPDQCFYGCTSLNSAALPASVITIGQYAFGNCTTLGNIVIPSSVTEIADNAFSGSDQVVICCERESYALAYALEKDLDYAFIITDPYLIGDADGDGSVNIIDATKIQRVLAELDQDPGKLIAQRGDSNGDGLDITDATRVQRYLAEFYVPVTIGVMTGAQA